MTAGVVRVATRASALAVAQARQAAEALASHGASVEIVTIETDGDRRAPDTAWGEGAFVSAIERALVDGHADVAVHSAKDIPTDEDARLRIIAYLPRADPRDALVVREGHPGSLADLPAGSVVGTDSPRRTGFLRARRPDVEVVPLHGNVDTRLRRLDEGAVDALVLAAAGLDRLGLGGRASERFAADTLPPAPGQGAIALQARIDDVPLAALGQSLDDAETRVSVGAERTFLAATGGGCRAPIGALGTVADGLLTLVGGFATIDGRASAVEGMSGRVDEAPAIAAALADRLVSLRATSSRGRVLVTRAVEQSDELVAGLAAHGLGVAVVPAIQIRPTATEFVLDDELRGLAAYTWVVVTSPNGARAALEHARRLGVDPRAGRWAAVGEATSRALAGGGVDSMWRPTRARGAAIADELPLSSGASVLLLRGSLADDELPRRMGRRGAKVKEVVLYETIEAPPESRPLLEQAVLEEPPSVVIFASPSAIRGLLALAAEGLTDGLLNVPAVCIGPTTAAAAREHGFSNVVEAPSPDAGALAELAAQVVVSQATVAAT